MKTSNPFGPPKAPKAPKLTKVSQRFAKAGLHAPTHTNADGAANIMGRAPRASKEKPDG